MTWKNFFRHRRWYPPRVRIQRNTVVVWSNNHFYGNTKILPQGYFDSSYFPGFVKNSDESEVIRGLRQHQLLTCNRVKRSFISFHVIQIIWVTSIDSPRRWTLNKKQLFTSAAACNWRVKRHHLTKPETIFESPMTSSFMLL